jgi:hypothetical protein
MPLPASDGLQKGKGGRMQFYISSLPYFISPFVKRSQIGFERHVGWCIIAHNLVAMSRASLKGCQGALS